MLRLLCQVCGDQAERSEHGVLWLLKDHREDWKNWPEDMAVTEPPVCRRCVGVASRLCPALRRGAALLWAQEFPVVGVHGPIYRSNGVVTVPFNGERRLVAYDDPAVRWVCAISQVRKLNGCTLISTDEV
ncbi:HNH endonuclease [Kibdelosporangium persicum]